MSFTTSPPKFPPDSPQIVPNCLGKIKKMTMKTGLKTFHRNSPNSKRIGFILQDHTQAEKTKHAFKAI